MLELFATSPKGAEPLLESELESLGASGVRVTRSGVAFRGSLETAYRACLWSRTAGRILLPLASFPAATPDQLYQGVREVPWFEHLAPTSTFAVEATATRSPLTHTGYAALRVKDAVADLFRERTGSRPSVDRERPDLLLNLHLEDRTGIISLDLSGEPLHRRGYRGAGGAAPLKENLAAAILMRGGWPEIAASGGALADPMCGAGTLAIEGALMAADIAPGILRVRWGFSGWMKHERALWKELVAEAASRRREGLAHLPPVLGSDADARAVARARAAAERAGLAGRISWEVRPLGEAGPPPDRGPARESGALGLVAVNPPYGERLGEVSSLAPLYAELGSVLRRRFRGWRAVVFTGAPELGKEMGLRAHRSWSLPNGPIPCKLLLFDVRRDAAPAPAPRRHPAMMAEPAGEAALTPGGTMFANRLRKNLRNLGRWAGREGITCYRLYDADLPEYAVAVDIYERWAVVAEYEAPPGVDPARARARLAEALAAVSQVTRIPEERVYLKTRFRRKGNTQYEKLGAMGAFHRVHEGGLSFLVNFRDYLDTGLFLDHRPTRAMIRELARGKRFLNLFAYTGAATVCAAAGGASSTVTVDLSNTYTGWARKNLDLNGLPPAKHRVVRADCLKWIRQEKGRYELIFLDPPTFSRSKAMEGTFDVQRDHVHLLRAAARLLAPGGTMLFSTNLRTFKMDTGKLGALKTLDITDRTIPPDFARDKRIHSCWLVTR
jgi:23S rRNA (guanine2445-N2)-methyltransferase / 23S rRNA (guanine2069-N7)-methyltransferase